MGLEVRRFVNGFLIFTSILPMPFGMAQEGLTPANQVDVTPTPVAAVESPSVNTKANKADSLKAFTDLGPEDYARQVRAAIEDLKNLAPQDFVATAEKLFPLIEKYIERKKRVCQGEFSTIVLNGQEEENGQVQRLSPEEIKLCYQELKAMEVGYINNLFIARKRYLDYLHVLRIEELTRDRDAALKGIQQVTGKASAKASSRKTDTK